MNWKFHEVATGKTEPSLRLFEFAALPHVSSCKEGLQIVCHVYSSISHFFFLYTVDDYTFLDTWHCSSHIV